MNRSLPSRRVHRRVGSSGTRMECYYISVPPICLNSRWASLVVGTLVYHELCVQEVKLGDLPRVCSLPSQLNIHSVQSKRT